MTAPTSDRRSRSTAPQAREWLAANLERKTDGGAPLRGRCDHTSTKERSPTSAPIQKPAVRRRLRRHHLAEGVRRPGAHRRPRAGLRRGGRAPTGCPTSASPAAPPSACAPRRCWPTPRPSSSAATCPGSSPASELWVQFFSEPGAGSDLAGRHDPRRRATATAGSSTARRSGAAAPTTPTTACAWPAPTGTSPSTAGSPGSPSRSTSRASTCEPIREINGDAEFCQEFFDDVELTDDDVIGEVDQGWTVAQTMLFFERGGGRDERAPARRGDARALAPDLVALAHAGWGGTRTRPCAS